MRTSFKYPFSLLLITLLVLTMSQTQAHITTTNDNDIIASMCLKTPSPTLCETDIRSDPRSSKPDEKTVVLIMIDMVKYQFSEALAYAMNQAKSAHDPDTIRALNKCIEIYTFVVAVSTVSAKNGVETGQPKYAFDAMTDASSEADACVAAFHRKAPTPFVDRTRLLKETSAVAVGLVKIIM